MNKTLKKIGVFAPSSWVQSDDIEASARYCESLGYQVEIHPQSLARNNQSAGTHAEKLNAFYTLWERDDIDIIWAAGGGNRCLHWIDHIDYARLRRSPAKAVIGFSDVTALLNALYAQISCETYHGPTFNRLHRFTSDTANVFDLLNNTAHVIDLQGAEILQSGQADGPLIGGNLSLFQYLPHTLPGKFWQGGILFLEDWNEELSRMDRMLLHLKRSGVFDGIHGLILGDFGNTPESGTPFGFTLHDIIAEHLDDTGIPIVTHAPFGHGDCLTPLPIGRHALLEARTAPVKLTLNI